MSAGLKRSALTNPKTISRPWRELSEIHLEKSTNEKNPCNLFRDRCHFGSVCSSYEHLGQCR